ncbi:MAG: hypothetical protein QM650_04485 [Microlunatus sp.]
MTAALQPVLYSYDPEREAVWVDATPFQAHVAQLLAAGLTVPLIAQLAGVRERSVRHLAHGRDGRRIQRICCDTGRRLLRITTMEAHAIRFRPVPVRLSRVRLRTMVGAGCSIDQLAQQTGLDVEELTQIVGRGSATCSQLNALKIAVGYQRWISRQEPSGDWPAVA